MAPFRREVDPQKTLTFRVKISKGSYASASIFCSILSQLILSYSILSTELELIPEKLLNFQTLLQLNGRFGGSPSLSTKSAKDFPHFVKCISLILIIVFLIFHF